MFPSSQEEQQEILLACGERRELHCQAGGQPPPEAVWQRQTELGDLAPPVLSDYLGLGGNGSVLVVSHTSHQTEAMFVCLASNRKGSIERSVMVTSHDNCQEDDEDREVEEEEVPAEEHTVTEQGSLNLNCSAPPGPVLVQWEAVRPDGSRRYMTSWLAGLDQEYGRGCGEQYGMDTGGFAHLGCKVGLSGCSIMLLTPALFCHKDTAQSTQNSQRGHFLSFAVSL